MITLQIDNLAALRTALQQLPADLTVEAGHVIEGIANAAAADVKAAYPYRSGHLVAGVEVNRLEAGRFGAGSEVRNRAKLAWIYEHGTQARHYYTKQTGAFHSTGIMLPAPPGRAFIPIMVRQRALMYTQLADLVRRAGLLVNAGATT
jgi:hypothetical protein